MGGASVTTFPKGDPRSVSIRSLRALLVAMLAVAALALPRPALAQDDDGALAQQKPVAIVAGASGDVQIQIGSNDWRKAYALDLIPPTTQFKTGADGQLVIIYLYDDHRESLGPNSTGKSDFRGLTNTTGKYGKEPSRSGGMEFSRPYMAKVKLYPELFANVNDPGEMKKELDFMSAYVDVVRFPPIFHWRNAKLNPYRIQIFDEKKQFIYGKQVTGPRYDFPAKAPFQLTKSGTYYWQVIGPQDQMIVAQYAFRILTLPLVKYVKSQERAYRDVQAKQPGDTVSSTELFLVFNHYKTLDKGIHLLQNWAKYEPTNPNVFRYLCRAYILKGCPLLAQQALQQEIQLGGNDPVGP